MHTSFLTIGFETEKIAVQKKYPREICWTDPFPLCYPLTLSFRGITQLICYNRNCKEAKDLRKRTSGERKIHQYIFISIWMTNRWKWLQMPPKLSWMPLEKERKRRNLKFVWCIKTRWNQPRRNLKFVWCLKTMWNQPKIWPSIVFKQLFSLSRGGVWVRLPELLIRPTYIILHVLKEPDVIPTVETVV